MLRNLVSEEYNEVTLKEVFTGKKNYGQIFNGKFILSTKGKGGEMFVYVGDNIINTLDLELEFIIIGDNIYTNYDSFVGRKADEVKKTVEELNLNVIKWRDIIHGFITKFKKEYINYLIKSPRYKKYKKENIDIVKKEQHEEMLKGNFNSIDVYDSFVEKHNEGLELTQTDKIKYYHNHDLMLRLIEEYYNQNYIFDDRVMYANLYNELLEEEKSKDVLQIKEKVSALEKAGKTANILIGDRWIKVRNVLNNGRLCSNVGWDFYSIEDIKAIKFNGKVLYSNKN